MTRKAATKTQALPPETNAAGRAALRALVDARWEGNAAAAARELGVTKQTVNDYLNGNVGGGGRLASLVMKIEPLVGLAMLGSDVPALRSAPWVAEVASGLIGTGASNEAVGWAIIQALQFGRGRTRDDLREAAQVLLAVRLALKVVSQN